ncbi:Clostridial hydrophobic W [uncultured archaeon]|nr:Clostridial hydrophobic W [uncultured archaeon]
MNAPADPTLSVSPTSGSQGTTFYYSGTKYTPNGAIDWHVRKPDNVEYPVGSLVADASGNLNTNYLSHCGSMVGAYTIWAVDKTTGRRSNDVTETITAASSCTNVQYQAQFAYTGWMANWVQDGQTAGTPGGNQMEAIKIQTTSYGITYRAHVAYDGWLPWVSNGAVAGTVGQGKSLQAIEIKLLGAPSNLHVNYRVYVHGQGWQGWVSDGGTAGTIGSGLAVDAIEIKIQN